MITWTMRKDLWWEKRQGIQWDNEESPMFRFLITTWRVAKTQMWENNHQNNSLGIRANFFGIPSVLQSWKQASFHVVRRLSLFSKLGSNVLKTWTMTNYLWWEKRDRILYAKIMKKGIAYRFLDRWNYLLSSNLRNWCTISHNEKIRTMGIVIYILRQCEKQRIFQKVLKQEQTSYKKYP